MVSICDVTVVLCLLLLFKGSFSEDVACQSGSKCVHILKCPFFSNLLTVRPPEYLPDLVNVAKCSTTENKVCCPSKFENLPTLYNSTKAYIPGTDKCGIYNAADRIVGGMQTELDEHPWLALIRYDKPKGWGFYCAGVLITLRHVLTAAHCVKGSDLPVDWRLTQVRLGEWNISSTRDCIENDCSTGVLDVEVEKLIPHEDYTKEDENQQNDIAILKLARDVVFNDYIKPICLPLTKEQQVNSYDGYEMEVAGWGKTEKQFSSPVKLKARVPVVNNEKCRGVYRKVSRTISDKQICAGGQKGVDSCRGDSGGALMGQMPTTQNWVAIGVVSYGPTPCGTANWPGVYTRVGSYVDWILKNLS